MALVAICLIGFEPRWLWHSAPTSAGTILSVDQSSAAAAVAHVPEEVLSSRWSAIAGVVPVSGLAAGTYLAILIASFFIGPKTASRPDRRLAWGAILDSRCGAKLPVPRIWFIILQKWVIKALCPYCLGTHITGLLLAALVLWQTPKQFGDELTGRSRRLDFCVSVSRSDTGRRHGDLPDRNSSAIRLSRRRVKNGTGIDRSSRFADDWFARRPVYRCPDV